jgi:N6-L-threonylcarbamoyladenine synthase
MTTLLAIETSCDETSAALLRQHPNGVTLLSCVILSQDIHRVFGGVVPELASRAHLATIVPVVDRALAEAQLSLDGVESVAVTAGPGLVGALLVGVIYGKTLARRLGVPLIGVHHLEGHLFAPTLEHPEFEPPFVALLVSGGHTMLLDVPAWGRYRLLGATRDDAAGEAFDKVATLLGLGYPGGPAVERLAREGRPGRFDFPSPMLHATGFEFSFSGLKTAVMRAVKKSEDPARDRADIARGFQDAAIAVLVDKAAAAVELTGYPALLIGGGVACNRALQEAAIGRLAGTAAVVTASPRFNTDNAAMIGAAGLFRLGQGEKAGADLEPRADLPLPGLAFTPDLLDARR